MAFLQKIKNGITFLIQEFHLLVCTQKNWRQSCREVWYTHAHSSISHRGQQIRVTQVSTDRWADKQDVVYTVEYYAAVRRKNLTHAATQMNLEDIMLSEISQSQKDKCSKSSLTIIKYVLGTTAKQHIKKPILPWANWYKQELSSQHLINITTKTTLLRVLTG